MLSELAHVAAALPPVADALLRLTLFLAAARLLGPLLGRTNPRWQVFYWRAVAATTVVLLAVVLLGPTVSLPILEAESEQPSVIASSQPVSVSETFATETPLAQPAQGSPFVSSTPEIEYETVPAFMPVLAAAESTGWRGTQIVAVVWFLSALALIVGVLVKDWRMGRIVRRAKAAPAGATECLVRVAGDLGYQRSVRLRVSTQVDSPRVTGLFRPVLVLPETVDLSCDEDLRGIFAHEVSHLVSGDLFWARVIQLLSIGLWFHPLVWRIGRRHLDACEQVSDAAAAEYLGDSEAYAGILARVALHAIGSRALAGISMARTPRIRRRLLLLEKAICAGPPPRRRLMAVSAAVLALVTVGGAMRLVAARGPGREADVAENGSGVISAHGVVVDDRGQPVAGATVYLREWSNGRVARSVRNLLGRDLARTTTDQDGVFCFSGVTALPQERFRNAAKPWDVVCRKEGYGIAWKCLSSLQSPEPLQIQMATEAVVSGRVFDQSGNPLDGAVVEASRIDSLRGALFVGRSDRTLELSRSEAAICAISDSEGNIELRGLPAGRRVRVLVSHDNFVSGVVYVATTDDPQPAIVIPRALQVQLTSSSLPVFSRSFSIELKPGGCTLRGRVTYNDTGGPCEGARLELQAGQKYRFARTDRNGAYVIHDAIPVGRLHVLTPTGSRYLSRTIQVDLEEAESEEVLDVVLARGTPVTGTVVVEETGRAVSGVVVRAKSRERADPGCESMTDEAGRFRVAVGEGTSRLRIYGPAEGCLAPEYRTGAVSRDPRHFRDVEVTVGQAVAPVHFVVERGKVVDGLVNNSEGKPVSGATVRVYRQRRGSYVREQETASDQGGHFQFAGLNTLENLLLLADHGNSNQVAFLKLKADYSDEAASAQLILRQAAAFTGTVLLDGKPGAGIRVELGRDGGVSRSVLTDEEGNYRFALLVPAGGYHVTVSSELHTSCSLESLAASPGKTRELAAMKLVSHTASLSGIVVDPQGDPVEGVSFFVKFADGARNVVVPTAKDGRFAINCLPDEALELTAFIRPSAGYGSKIRAMTTVRLVPNQNDLRIPIDPELAAF